MRMNVFGLLCVAFVATAYADGNSTGDWIHEIAGSDYAVGYCQTTLTMSFYNHKMGFDLTFDGNSGRFSMINATTGSMVIVHSPSGMAELQVPVNKKKLLAAFSSKNNTQIFTEAAIATVNGTLSPGENTFPLFRFIMGLFTKRNNDHLSEMHGQLNLLLELRKELYAIRAALIVFQQTHPLRTENGVLIFLVSALTGPKILQHDIVNFISTLNTYLNGRFNQDLMAKVGSLLEGGQKEKFSKNIFNSVSAAISLVAPYTTGLDLQIATALNIAY